MDQDTDADLGGEELSVEQAAAAFVKSNEEGADQGQPEPEDEDIEADNAEDDELSDEDDDESEGEPDDEEGQPDEEDEDEPETERGRFVAANGRVKLPDGSVATVDELIQGNLKDRDYRQKTMSLAEEKRAFEAQSSEVKASLQQVQEQREYTQRLLESLMPQPPHADMLNANSPDYDPIGYTEQKAIYDNFAAHNQYLQQQAQAYQSQTAEQQQQSRQEKQNAEWNALLEAMPVLKDSAKLNAFSRDIKSAGEAYGFSPKEIAESLPQDHRMAIVLRDAASWRKLQSSKPKTTEKLKGRPPVQRSGKRLSSGAQKAQRASDAISRLKETGSVEDATRAFLASMNKG